MNNSKSIKAHIHGADYEAVSDSYLEKRQLKSGAVGWVLLASLGVSYVISGSFAGWNFGLAQGGFGGLLIATVLMAIMYFAMVFSLAELSAALPTAGGGYSFARRAFGPLGGFMTGAAILIEYAIAAAAIAIFIGGYVSELTGVNGPVVYAIFYSAFIGIHLFGAGEALKIMMCITAIAVVALLIFVIGMVPHFNVNNLTDIKVVEDAVGASKFLPFGYMGIWASLPFAMWLFLAIEGVPLAAEESRNPAKDVPKGIIAAICILSVSACSVLFLAPGGAGAQVMSEHGAPLVGALQAVHGEHSKIAAVLNIVGLFGLIASFFSVIYAYSRQLFALSRAGYLPRFLSVTGKNKVPVYALIVPGVIGFLCSLTGEGDLMITMAVFGATVSYALMMSSHIVLRFKEPNLDRPYKTPGGILTSSVALVFSLIALASTFLVSKEAAMWSAVVYAVMLAYFIFYSRHHLVAKAPEEEFEAIIAAQLDIN